MTAMPEAPLAPLGIRVKFTFCRLMRTVCASHAARASCPFSCPSFVLPFSFFASRLCAATPIPFQFRDGHDLAEGCGSREKKANRSTFSSISGAGPECPRPICGPPSLVSSSANPKPCSAFTAAASAYRLEGFRCTGGQGVPIAPSLLARRFERPRAAVCSQTHRRSDWRRFFFRGSDRADRLCRPDHPLIAAE